MSDARGEITQRTKLAKRTAEEAERTLHRVYAILGVLAGCVLLGIIGTLQYGKLAQASDVRTLETQQIADRVKTAEVGARLNAIDEHLHDFGQQLNRQADVIWKIAGHWHLDAGPPPQVPPPAHP